MRERQSTWAGRKTERIPRLHGLFVAGVLQVWRILAAHTASSPHAGAGVQLLSCGEDYCCSVEKSAALTCGPSQRAIPSREARASTSEKLASHRPTDAEFANSFAW